MKVTKNLLQLFDQQMACKFNGHIDATITFSVLIIAGENNILFGILKTFSVTLQGPNLDLLCIWELNTGCSFL